MDSTNFYKVLPYVEAFENLGDDSLYCDVPIDWYVLVTDIKDSTIAIEEGRYKEVNFIAACSVTAVLNIDKYTDIPFVFGGDGCTMLIPPKFLNRALDVLRDTKEFAKREFNMALRIGVVPVIDVVRGRYQIRILKVRVAENYYQSIFQGGGLDYAEFLIKNNPKYRIMTTKVNFRANYQGLECIWQDIPSKKEEVVSLLVKANGDVKHNSNTYNLVISEINKIYGDFENRFPVNKRSIKIRPNLNKILLESKIFAFQFEIGKRRSFIYIFAKTIFDSVMNSLVIGIKTISHKAYEKAVIHSIDSEKMDDMLRMVISGTKEQRHQLRGFLEELYQTGEISYGLHVTHSVYMTCLVFSRHGNQVHFIDGANGGYTHAARELKNKMKWQRLNKLV